MTSPATALPVRTLVLARRVRGLVVTSALLTVISSVASWSDGGAVTLPGVAVLVAHLVVQAGVTLPVSWQFSGDLASTERRQRRAVRAMTFAFVVLVGLAAFDAVRAISAVSTLDAGPARTASGPVAAVLALVAVPVLVALDTRSLRTHDERGPGLLSPAALAGVEALLLAGLAGDLFVGPGPALCSVWLVVVLVAGRQAVGAWRGDGVGSRSTAARASGPVAGSAVRRVR